MGYSANDKARCDAIMDAFRPYLARHSYKGRVYFDIVYSDKFGVYFRLVDTTPDGDMSEIDATYYETPQELLEGLLYETVNDTRYGNPKMDVAARRLVCDGIVAETLGRMDADDRAAWESVMVNFLDNADFGDDD